MLEPSPEQIKARRNLYRTMGLTTEEFAMVEKILRPYFQIIQKQVYFPLCGQNIVVIKTQSQY